MSEWKEYKLKDLTYKIGSGSTPRGGSNTYKTFGISLIRSQNVLDFLFTDSGLAFIDDKQAKELDSVTVKENDILFNITGDSVARCCMVPSQYLPARVNQHVAIVRTNEKVSNKYIFYYLQFLKPELLISAEIGATRNAITKAMLENIDISIPPLPEQRTIASILSSLDDKIDLLQRQNNTLEKMAETLFRQWFVEEAKEEWEEGKLGYEFDFTMGQSPAGISFNENGVGNPMYQGNADFGFRFPNKRVYTTDPKRFAEKYDTLISVRAPVGAQNMAREKCCIGRGVAAFRYKKNNEFYSYTYYKMMSLMDDIKQFNETGTVFGSISKSDFENLDIVIPDYTTIKKFQEKVQFIDNKIINNSKQIQSITKLRDTLLPKLMSGEVKIKKINILYGEN